MVFPSTYRFRLVAYISVLLVFLLAVLALSYHDSRSLILQEAEGNVGHVAQQIEAQLGYKAHDHQARARMIRDNQPLTEYLFITASLDADAGAVRELYARQFGWLPTDRVVLLGASGKAVLGAEHRDLIQVLRARGAPKQPLNQQFYVHGGNGLELVSVAEVNYRSQYLGVVAITEVIGANWMAAARRLSNGHLLMTKDDKVILSTLEGARPGDAFVPAAGMSRVGDDEYLARQIGVGAADPTLPTLWFLQSTADLTERINRQRNLMLVLAAVGGIDILLVGFLMLRNFSAPLKDLVAATKEVGEGRFPEFPETASRDEIGTLWNQFAAMVHSLHDKQGEIARAHAELERLATTDALTGLYNRRYLEELFPKLASDARRQGKALTVIVADIDKFKDINDKYGHQVGDEALVHFAHILKNCTRISDFVFRTGGEEFLLLASGDLDSGLGLAEKVRATLEATPLASGDLRLAMTASFGVAQMDAEDGRLDSMGILSTMTNRADKLLYAAKRAGRNRVMGGAAAAGAPAAASDAALS